ncbi:MAG: hypothetical protein AAB656_04395, partial [Patescibacteria group bacterium]
IFLTALAIFFVFSYLAVKSLKLLNFKIAPYYDFDKFFPKSGTWSIVFYLLILGTFVGLVLYFGRTEIASFFPA